MRKTSFLVSGAEDLLAEGDVLKDVLLSLLPVFISKLVVLREDIGIAPYVPLIMNEVHLPLPRHIQGLII